MYEHEWYGETEAGAAASASVNSVAEKVAALAKAGDIGERRRLLDEIPKVIADGNLGDDFLAIIEKAHRLQLNKRVQNITGVKADIFAPEVISQLEAQHIRRKTYKMNPATLRLVAHRDPVFRAIVNTRSSQLQAFCRRPRGKKGEKGFVIIPADPEYKMKTSERRIIKELTSFFLKTGFVMPKERRKGRWWEYRDEDLRMVAAMLVEDTLSLDQTNIYIQRTKGGLPWAFWMLDPALVYRVLPKEGKSFKKRYSQVDPLTGLPKYFYTEEEMIFDVMNPTTDLRHRGYGHSVLETLLEIITGLLFGISYNRKQFQDSTLPKSLIAIVGDMSDEAYDAFKREWLANMTGAQPWRTPVVQIDKEGQIQHIPLFQSNKDMEFLQWLQFLITVECSVCQIDPEEIGFRLNISGSSTLFPESPGAAGGRVEASKDRGLAGMLNYVEEQFTKITRLFPGLEDFTFEFIGLHEEDDLRKLEAQRASMEVGLSTVREAREAEGLELPKTWEDKLFLDAPLNPMLYDAYMREMGGGEQPGAEGPPGEPGAEGEEQEAAEYPSGDYDDLIRRMMGGKGEEKPAKAKEEPEEERPVEKSVKKLTVSIGKV